MVLHALGERDIADTIKGRGGEQDPACSVHRADGRDAHGQHTARFLAAERIVGAQQQCEHLLLIHTALKGDVAAVQHRTAQIGQDYLEEAALYQHAADTGRGGGELQDNGPAAVISVRGRRFTFLHQPHGNEIRYQVTHGHFGQADDARQLAAAEPPREGDVF